MPFKILVPNLVTLSRLPLATACLVFAEQKQWPLAFLFLAAAAATDWIDGYLAIKLKAATKTGYYLDKFCDLFMVATACLGLRKFYPLDFFLVFIVPFLLLWAVILTFSEKNKFRQICRGVSPFYFITVVLALNIIYAQKAFGAGAWWLFTALVPFILYGLHQKKHRIKNWLNGQG